MKRFIYYNQDSVNSFLAQIEQGLLVNRSGEDEHSETTSSTTGIDAKLTGDLRAKVLGIGASLQGDVNTQNADTEVATNLIKSIQEKVLHDYAFEKVYSHIIENNLINNDDPKIGDIVLTTERPTFLDFKYFQALFGNNGAVKMSNEQDKKNLDKNIAKIKDSAPKGTQVPATVKMQIEDLKNKVQNAEPERKQMAKTLEAIKNTIPYNRFIMTENMLIPLDDDNFRDNPDIVAFKYGGDISILGYVTNIITNEETSRSNDFAPVYDIVNKVMLSLFKEQDSVYVIHPVAVYY